MALSCDYCGEPIDAARVNVVPPVYPPAIDPNVPVAPQPFPLDLHEECGPAWWEAATKSHGKRPVKGTP